jgi:TRAP-type C4-dicarboxylate transport system permease large subunit
MAVAYVLCNSRGYGLAADLPDAGKKPRLLPAIWGALPSLLLVIIVLGGILAGIFTATEASAIAVLWAFLLGVVFYREIKLS